MAKVQQITDIPNEILDQFAEDRLAVEAFKPTQNSYDRGWARVKLALQVNPANKPVTLKGKKYTVEIASCEMQRKVRAVASVFEKLKKLPRCFTGACESAQWPCFASMLTSVILPFSFSRAISTVNRQGCAEARMMTFSPVTNHVVV